MICLKVHLLHLLRLLEHRQGMQKTGERTAGAMQCAEWRGWDEFENSGRNDARGAARASRVPTAIG